MKTIVVLLFCIFPIKLFSQDLGFSAIRSHLMRGLTFSYEFGKNKNKFETGLGVFIGGDEHPDSYNRYVKIENGLPITYVAKFTFDKAQDYFQLQAYYKRKLNNDEKFNINFIAGTHLGFYSVVIPIENAGILHKFYIEPCSGIEMKCYFRKKWFIASKAMLVQAFEIPYNNTEFPLNQWKTNIHSPGYALSISVGLNLLKKNKEN